MPFQHKKITFITALVFVVTALSSGVLLAQVWEEPPAAPPTSEGDDATPGLDVLYSGTTSNAGVGCSIGACGGGEAQRRSGALTIGSATPATSSDLLTVFGVAYVTDTLKVGSGDINPVFGNDGIITGAIETTYARDTIVDDYLYVIGEDETPDWRIEKRSLLFGTPASGFGTDGVITGDATSRTANAVAADNNYLYIAGQDENLDWRIEKRSKTDGALDTSFGYDCSTGACVFTGDGVVTGDSLSYNAFDVAIDSNYMYVVGNDESATVEIRIEKRRLSDGALCTAVSCGTEFGIGGAVTGAVASQFANSIVIDSTYMYIAGQDENMDWRIEKRRLTNGIIDPLFGVSGIVTGDALTQDAFGITSDATYMYVVGRIDTTAGWRIEKRRLTNGALCTAAACGTEFGVGGAVSGDPATQIATDVLIDGGYVYVVGFDTTGNNWRVEKLSAISGAPDTIFGTNGVIISENESRFVEGISIYSNFIYTVGYDEVPADWRIEKRSIANGALNADIAAVSAYATDSHAIYGETVDASYSGIHGAHMAALDGKSVWGFTNEPGGRAVSASATGNNIAIRGYNPTSWAAYFDGDVEVITGIFVAENGTFSSDVVAQKDITVDGVVTIGGMDIERINALSIQDQSQAVPASPPGVQFFTLSAFDVADGSVQSWTGAETGLADTDLITSITALYRDTADSQAKWKKYPSEFDANLTYRQCGGGVTWVGGVVDPTQQHIMGFVEDDEGNLYVGSQTGGNVYKSTDNGMTWTNTSELTGATEVWSLLFASDGALYAGTDNSSVYKSTDKGESWLPQSLTGSIEVYSLIEDSTGKIWAGTFNGYLFWTDNGGSVWNRINDLQLAGVVATNTLLEDEIGNLYAGTMGGGVGEVYKSLDGGASWNVTGALVGVQSVQVLLQDSNLTIFAGAGVPNGRVWRTYTKGWSWVDTGQPTGVDEIDSMLESSSGDLYAGTSNLGFVFKSSDGGTVWNNIGLNPGVETVELFEDERGYLYAVSGNSVSRTGAPEFLTGTAGSIAVKNTTGAQADFRIMGTYIPGANTCP